MPIKFIELTDVETNEKILINVNYISKFHADGKDNGTIVWVDGGYVVVKEKYLEIRRALFDRLDKNYISVIINVGKE